MERTRLITAETTLEGMRAAAFAIVTGRSVTLSDGRVINAPTDSLDFLNSTGAWANNSLLHTAKDLDGVTTTGLGNIDFWVGGLAEKQMPFGGLLGSSFNFVFENQLEALQNGDRFYYLARTAGLNFGTELENNTFSQLVMLNTDVKHLPADIFSTPTWTLEVDPEQAVHRAWCRRPRRPDRRRHHHQRTGRRPTRHPEQPGDHRRRQQLSAVHRRGPHSARRH